MGERAPTERESRSEDGAIESTGPDSSSPDAEATESTSHRVSQGSD